MKKFYFLFFVLLSVTVFGQTYTFTTFNTNNSGIASNSVQDFKQSSTGTLWIATNNGLSAMIGNNFTNYTVNNSTIATNYLNRIAVSGANVWAGTYQQGLVYRNGTTGAFANYTMSNSGIPTNMPTGIATDSQGNLWMASASGLTKFNGTTWTTYNTSNSQIGSNDVTSVAVDAGNNVWITSGNLLRKFNGNTFTIITDGVAEILKVTPGAIYVSTGDGLGKIVNNQFTDVYYADISCLASCSIKAAGVDETNKVWLGLDSCGNYEGGIQNFTNCTTYTTSNSALPHNSITSIHVIDSNVIWAGTLEGGLVRMNKTDGPVCNPPTQPYVAQYGDNTAYLAWTPANPAPAAGYIYRYNTVNNVAGAGAIESSTSQNGAGIDQLQPNTTYYWWVASDCQPLTWVSGGSFTTEPAPSNTCNPPTNLSINQFELTSTSVNIQWDAAIPAPSGYLYAYNTVNTVGGNDGYTQGTAAWIDGLTPNTTYYWWVASDCQPQQWVPGGSFTTPAASGCGVPTALSVSNITSNSSRLNWNAPASAPSSYELYIVTTNTPPTANTTNVLTSTTAGVGVLSGLSASTTYYYWIRSNCGTTKSAWVSGGSFTTIAALTCNGASNGLYPAATFTPACTGGNEQIATDAYAGEYANVNILSNKQYTFTSSITTDYITVTNATGTVVYAHGQTPLNWSSDATSGLIRYYLHSNANCGDQQSSRTRSIKCVDAPVSGCGVPTALSVSNITSNSSRLNWNAPASAPSSYELYIVTTNTPPTANTTNVLTSTTAGVGVLSVLAPSTTYYYWIRSNCGATKSAWVSGGSFTTTAALTCNGAANGLYPDATFTPACTGSNEQIVNNAYAGEYSNVNVVGNKEYTFSSSVATDYITVTNATGTIVYASGQTPVNWQSGTTSGLIRYYLHSNANCGDQETSRVRYIKCIDAAVSCPPPSGLSVSNITSNSVRVQWVMSANSQAAYDIYVSPTNTAPGPNPSPIVATNTTNRQLLPGLNASTVYYYWVRTYCSSSSKSTWVYGGSFTTAPLMGCNGATYGVYPEATFTPACTGSNEQIVNNAYAGEYTNVNISANKQYTFSSSIATDYITVTNATGTVVYASGQTPVSWTSGTTSGLIRYHLHSNANCGDGATPRVRYIKCANAPVTACEMPSALSVSNITSNSCRISWSEPAAAPSNYDVYISTNNTWPEYNANPTASPMSSILVSYSPLAAATTYYYWVRSVCGSSKSDWTSGGSFTTLPSLNCNGAIFGLYPEDTVTLQNDGSSEPVAYQAMAGQYSNVTVAANKQYTFSSSIATDYITVTNADGTVVLASGTTPLTWVSGNTSGTVRFYLHADVNCGADDMPRNRFATGSTLGVDDYINGKQVSMYPNPTKGQFTVDAGNTIPDNIMIFDNIGRIVSTHKPNAAKTTLMLDGLSDGIYYVKVNYQDKNYTEKLVLKKD
jgi:phosphoribosyl-AMP cyclohydrolase